MTALYIIAGINAAVLALVAILCLRIAPRRQNNIGNNHPHCIAKGSGGVSFHEDAGI